MKVIKHLFFVLAGLLVNAQNPSDTLVLTLKPSAGSSFESIQNALNNKNGRILKINFRKGIYNLDKTDIREKNRPSYTYSFDNQ